MRWKRIDASIARDIVDLRAKLERARIPADVYPERLIHTYRTSGIEEGLLSAQFEISMFRAMDLQERKAAFAEWWPLLNTALKVSATLKGPRWQNLVALREILRLVDPTIPAAQEVTLAEYLATSEKTQRAATSTEDRARPQRTAEPGPASIPATEAPPPA